MSRWFSLTSPCDFLHFLPPADGSSGADGRLRLISSSLGLLSPLEELETALQNFSTSLAHTENPDVYRGIRMAGGSRTEPPYPLILESSVTSGAPFQGRTRIAQLARRSRLNPVGHYGAVPLSDGMHFLFIDPDQGLLCLGGDNAPIGSLARLSRRFRFLAPSSATTSIPLLYAAGSDMSHGVRVVATFSVCHDWNDVPDGSVGRVAVTYPQMVMFYTIPPDLMKGLVDEEREASVLPQPIEGQAVAMCDNAIEVAVDASPEMIVTVFTADGRSRVWALKARSHREPRSVLILDNGNVRTVDHDGDLQMIDAPGVLGVPERMEVPMFDGATGMMSHWKNPRVDRVCRLTRAWTGRPETSRGPMVLGVMEERSGLVRIDVDVGSA